MPPSIWLVTGTSSGFGEEFVKQITARGDKVIATARNLDKVKHLKDTGAAFLQLDVTASQDELNRKVKEAIGIYGRIDVLVNNAGYVGVGTLEEVGHERMFHMFNTVVFGSEKLTRSILPHFRERRDGLIVFNGSMWGWEGVTANSMYCGAKFALEGIVESLAGEVRPLGIKTLLVEPGFFRTAILTPENVKLPDSTIKDYEQINQGIKETLEGANGKQPGDPVRGVEIILDVVKREGVAAGQGKEYPARLPLGTDALECLRKKCRDTLKLLDEWERIIVRSDFPKGE